MRGMTDSLAGKTLRLVRKAGVLRPRDLDSHGIPRTYLQRLLAKGALERVSFGLYRVAGADFDERQSFAEVAQRFPNAVVCLLSALQFHGLTTQSPHKVWVALPTGAWRPRHSPVPLQIIHLSGKTFEYGVAQHRVGGATVRVYEPAKTVADCFKFRSKVRLDVALEALRDYRKQRGSLDELWRAATVCRVARVIKPYIEFATAC